MLPTEKLFATSSRRIASALVTGAAISFVLGSFASFFVMFAAKSIHEGQPAPDPKPTIFRIFAALFLIAAFAIHFYASLTFRYLESKKVFDFSSPRPALCGAFVVLFAILNLMPSVVEKPQDSWAGSDSTPIRETYSGWPATHQVKLDFQNGPSKTQSVTWGALVNGLILLLGIANVFAFDPSSLKPKEDPVEEEERKKNAEEEKKKKEPPPEDDDWEPPQMAPKAD